MKPNTWDLIIGICSAAGITIICLLLIIGVL